MADTATFSPGLAGVVAGETHISCVDQGKLLYRGYPIEELAEKVGFEEVAYLMLYGELPNAAQLKQVQADLAKSRPLRKEVVEAAG